MALLDTNLSVKQMVLIEKILHRTIKNNLLELVQMEDAPECSRQIQQETNDIQQILNDLNK